MTALAGCPLCDADGGRVVFRAPRWRLIHVTEAGFPAFYRVVWNEHAAEFSDLCAEDRAECMEVVVAVEQALRRHLSPTKVNLATLGNAVPHLHWHVIARFGWDSHFPGSVWAQPQRPVDEPRGAEVQRALPGLEQALIDALRPLGGPQGLQ